MAFKPGDKVIVDVNRPITKGSSPGGESEIRSGLRKIPFVTLLEQDTGRWSYRWHIAERVPGCPGFVYHQDWFIPYFCDETLDEVLCGL